MKAQIKIKQSKDYDKNADRVGEKVPCIICGKGINGEKHPHWLHAHGGSLATVVTEAEAVRLNKAGEGGADMGCWPIGSDCLKKNLKLKPFLVKIK